MTIHNQSGRFNGWLDEGITPAQAEQLHMVEFQTHRFDAIYCSPLKRCRETALALGIVESIEDARLKERNLGIFEGKTPAECETLHRDDFARFRELDADFVIPNGESRKQNLERVLSWVRDVSHHQRVLAVTHGGPIDFLYRMGAGLPLHGGEMYPGRNAHHSIFSYNDDAWSVIQFDMPLQ